MLEIYNGNILVAKQIDKDFVEDTGTGLELPYEVWGLENKGKVSVIKVLKWVYSRVPPETQDNLVNNLEKIYEIKKYNKRKMVDICDSKFLNDNFVVKNILPTDMPIDEFLYLIDEGVF